jgi:hypothetical protein
MKKGNFPILFIIGIILFLIVINSDVLNNESAAINVHYYKNGAEVFPKNFLFSIINGGGSYDAISFSTTITNNGQTPFSSVKITSINIESSEGTNRGYITWNSPAGTPVYTNGNYYQTIGDIAVGESKTITSQQYEVATLEQFSQPISFFIKGTAMNTYTGNTTTFNSSKVSLTIEPDLPTYKICYQESANVANQTGKDNCVGMKYSGDYSNIGTWSGDINLAYDGNTETYVNSNNIEIGSYLYINYTKPEEKIIDATWMLTDVYYAYNSGGLVLVTRTNGFKIPFSCINYSSNKVILRIHSIAINSANWECYNQSWVVINHRETNNVYDSYIFEEAIYWNVTSS